MEFKKDIKRYSSSLIIIHTLASLFFYQPNKIWNFCYFVILFAYVGIASYCYYLESKSDFWKFIYLILIALMITRTLKRIAEFIGYSFDGKNIITYSVWIFITLLLLIVKKIYK